MHAIHSQNTNTIVTFPGRILKSAVFTDMSEIFGIKRLERFKVSTGLPICYT